jgi:tetratricopeptide (TPR) repeat protein
MKNQGHKIRAFSAWVFVLIAIAVLSNCGKKETPVEPGDAYERGLSLFKEGFYGLLPQGKTNEAMETFKRAEESFRNAAADKKHAADSHRYLARIYSIRKQFPAAADEYRKAIEIEPENIDNYIFLASVYVRLEKYDEARKTLNHAKTLSREAAVVGLIEDLIRKIEERSRPAGA